METKELLIHILDDDEVFVKMIDLFLRDKGYQNIKKYHSSHLYLSLKEYEEKPDIIFIDYFLEKGNTGDKVLKAIKKHSRTTEAIMMSYVFDEEMLLLSGKNRAYTAISKSNNFIEKLDQIMKNMKTHIINKSLKKVKRKSKILGISLWVYILISTTYILIFS